MPYIGAGVQRFNTADNLTVTGTSELKNNVTVTGDVTASGTVLPTGDTAAGDAAALGFTSAEGLILTGQGSTSDVTIKNDADATVAFVPTGADDLRLPDNAELQFGDSGDLKIYHNGSTSFIEDVGTGNFLITTNGNNIQLMKDQSEQMLVAKPDDAVELYYDNVKTLETTSTGIDIQGSAGATLKLTSTDTSGADTELLGQIDFVSSDSSTGSAGTQARIKGVYEDNGDSSGLEFFCGASTGSGTPTLFKRMTLSHDGENPAASIITDDNVTNLALISTDADGSLGPKLDLTRDSSSPADGDNCGQINFKIDNDAGESTQYGDIFVGAIDVSDGTEDAHMTFSTMKGGSRNSRMKLHSDETVFNEDSVDVDFRVESNGNDKMIFVDGENDFVGIGGTPNVLMHVIGPAAQVAIDTTSGGEPLVRFRENGTTRGLLKMDGSNNIQFHTGPDGAVAEVARFNSSGHLNIGQTSTNIPGQNNTTAGISLRSVGDGYFSRDNDLAVNANRNGGDGTCISLRRGGTQVGAISVTSSSTTYNTSSDARLKSNIEDAASASDKIDAIQVRQFDWNETGNHQDYGLIAQELQSIEPMAVTGDADSDDMMGVDYSKLVPMLIKAVQEQQATIKSLETRLAALESQENKLTQNIITIDGKEYKPEDMDEKQTYLISQIRSCQNKAANIRFELDQVQAAQNLFTNELIKSVQTEEVQAEVG